MTHLSTLWYFPHGRCGRSGCGGKHLMGEGVDGRKGYSNSSHKGCTVGGGHKLF